MAINPLEKKRQTAFLLGVAVMGVVTLIVSGLLFSLWRKTKSELNAELKKAKTYQILKSDKKSGEEITMADLATQTGIKYSVDPKNTFTSGNFQQGKKYYAKTDLVAKSVLTPSQILESEEGSNETTTDKTERLFDISGVLIPKNLEKGDSIDIRMSLPDFQDFVVISKKTVKATDSDLIWLYLTEDEIRSFSSALMESYIMKGAKLYAVKYTEAGIQERAKVTYPVNQVVLKMLGIEQDNFKSSRVSEFLKQQSENRGAYAEKRNSMQGFMAGEEERKDLINAGVDKEKNLKDAKRREYLQSVGVKK